MPLADNGEVSASDFAACVDFAAAQLSKHGKRILIHCDAGRNRSAAIVTALLVLRGEFPDWDAAYAYVKSQRGCVGCNSKVKESVMGFLPTVA